MATRKPTKSKTPVKARRAVKKKAPKKKKAPAAIRNPLGYINRYHTEVENVVLWSPSDNRTYVYLCKNEAELCDVVLRAYRDHSRNTCPSEYFFDGELDVVLLLDHFWSTISIFNYDSNGYLPDHFIGEEELPVSHGEAITKAKDMLGSCPDSHVTVEREVLELLVNMSEGYQGG